MSVFQGKLHGYPLISVDNFTKETFSCTAFFLSHCHTDHMDGLVSEAFLDFLQSKKKIHLYCSETTKNLLQSDSNLRILCPHVEGIPISQPTMIDIPQRDMSNSDSVLVTLIPAGHCVGSVMFLFEGQKGAVLYTGDFRMKKGDIKRIECLQTNKIVKKISELYIDTTFCTPSIQWLPSREESKESIISLMKSWLKNGDNKAVFIQCSAKYGYEYILKEIAIAFNTKIHVDGPKFDLYTAIPGMSDFVTSFGEETKIHSCHWKNYCTQSCFPCGVSRIREKPLKILKIKPSTLWVFKKKVVPNDNIIYDEKLGVHRVVHSMHSSFEEFSF
ncbi:protein artemis-like isoform X2 [Rhopilema esculentum]|uniref:protein artemis-like isoform X2 n=1 Tax=Rhopilema esculentum TaxID=499914 RepID=UPI0031DD28A3